MSQEDGSKIQTSIDWPLPLLGLLLAIAIAYGVGWVQSRDNERLTNGPASHAEAARSIAKRACSRLPTEEMVDCISDHITNGIDQANTERDLVAQYRAATGAVAAAAVSALALIATIVGLFYIRATLQATLRAVEESSDATKQMIKSNEIAERSHRPWLSILLKSISVTQDRLGNIAINYSISTTNSGQSPAVIVNATVCIEHADINRKIDFNHFVRMAYKHAIYRSDAVAPNTTAVLSGRIALELNTEQKDQFQQSGGVPPLLAGVAYQDGYSKRVYYTVFELLAVVVNGPASSQPGREYPLNYSIVKTLMGDVP